METLQELLEIGRDIWATGNRWLRIALILVIGWPIILCLVAVSTDSIGMKATLALAGPLLTIFIVVFASPMSVAAIGAIKSGRTLLQWTILVIGAELAIGIIFSVVNFAEYRAFAPLLLLVIITLALIELGGKKVAKSTLWLALIVALLATLYQCGRELVENEVGAYRESHAPKGFIEGDLWIATGPTKVKPKRKTKTERVELGEKDVAITTPCEEMYSYIDTLESGENIQIRHIDFGPDFPTRNRCSYNDKGDSIPIYGEPDKVTRPRFRHDLPFPDMPPGVMVFAIQDARGNLVAHDYIREAGGIIYFNNPLTEKAEVHLQYNYMQAFLTDPAASEQIGWDGSTATFHATRFRSEPSEPSVTEVENH